MKITCDWEEEVSIPKNDKNYTKCLATKKDKTNFCNRKFYNKYLFRYSLTYKFDDKNDKKHITVILMNPSFADEDALDATLNNVKEFVGNNGFTSFTVLNIFPLRMPKNDNLREMMAKYDNHSIYKDKNENKIEEVLNNSKYILLAWGSKYNNEAVRILDKLEKLKNATLYVHYLNKDSSPRHFSPLIYNRNYPKKLHIVSIKDKKICMSETDT